MWVVKLICPENHHKIRLKKKEGFKKISKFHDQCISWDLVCAESITMISQNACEGCALVLCWLTQGTLGGPVFGVMTKERNTLNLQT